MEIILPSYAYHCDDCKTDFSIIQSISEYKLKKKCDLCKSKNIYRIYDVYGVSFKTVGHFADIQTSKMSDDEKLTIDPDYFKERSPRIPESEKIPDYVFKDKDKIQKYIETGKY